MFSDTYPTCTSSRYIDEDRFKGILQTLGWSTVQHHDSAMLTHWLLQKGTPDNEKWPRREIRTGVKHNNFVLIVK